MSSSPLLRNSDGSWKYTNKLIYSSSPYLLQHAHNPVEWHPWGEEALALAKEQDKPLLVSIGYSTCYWCHVMERQIFCNPKMAELMNQHFINIKIDREERPDLDMIYMAARQLMTREGGWPNNVVLTPDLKPFFAGGTFAVDNRYGKPAFNEIIHSIAELWVNKRETLLKNADEVTHYIHAELTAEKRKYAVDTLSENRLPDKLYEQLLRYADKINGGFFHAPKFPQESYLLFLMQHYQQTNEAETLDIVTSSLDKMATGGLYDHVGGGFHRYTVDEEWKVPHFEKMLYNQALLSHCYAEAFSITNDSYYRYVAESTIDFTLNYMTGKHGGFYSALDAETNEVEGAYYSWSKQEINNILSLEEQKLFYSCFALADIPQFDGHKHPEGGVLYVFDLGIRQEQHTKIISLLAKLNAHRGKRPLPMLDTKVITAWHSMMATALARASIAFGNSRYSELAEKSGQFILHSLQQEDGRLLRIETHDQKPLYGFLEDYAFTLQAFLALYEATRKPCWLEYSLRLTEKILELFNDNEDGGFFFSESTQKTLVRIKDADDSSFPSANAIMLHNMVTLLTLTSDSLWYSRAEHLIAPFKGDLQRSPISYTHMIAGISRLAALHRCFAAPSVSGYVNALLALKPEKITVGKPFIVTITITIDDGWYIYDAQKQLHGTPTHVVISSQAPLKIQHIHYPEGKNYYPALGDEPISIYQGEINITAELVLEAPLLLSNIVPIVLLVEWQPCSADHCLTLEGVKLEFSVTVEKG